MKRRTLQGINELLSDFYIVYPTVSSRRIVFEVVGMFRGMFRNMCPFVRRI